MGNFSLIRWVCFRPWLEAGGPGALPRQVQATFGPVGAYLPLARQVAASVDAWLLALCQQRQRTGLALRMAQDGAWLAALRQDMQARLAPSAQVQRQHTWLGWRMEAELLRLVRLLEGPEMEQEVQLWDERFWALAASLIRLGQAYQALVEAQGEAQAQRSYREAAARAWQRATRE
jgi:hypothetical protein